MIEISKKTEIIQILLKQNDFDETKIHEKAFFSNAIYLVMEI